MITQITQGGQSQLTSNRGLKLKSFAKFYRSDKISTNTVSLCLICACLCVCDVVCVCACIAACVCYVVLCMRMYCRVCMLCCIVYARVCMWAGIHDGVLDRFYRY